MTDINFKGIVASGIVMTSSPAWTPGFPHAGGIAYRPTEATCGFVCSSLGTRARTKKRWACGWYVE